MSYRLTTSPPPHAVETSPYRTLIAALTSISPWSNNLVPIGSIAAVWAFVEYRDRNAKRVWHKFAFEHDFDFEDRDSSVRPIVRSSDFSVPSVGLS